MLNCKTGEDFERLVLDTLQTLNFEAHQTGREDRGVDIIAFKTVDGHRYRFDIQCKFWNTTVGMKPIQEVYAGSHYFNQGGTPVVFTNNRVTLEARQYARRLGVEVIGDAEAEEIARSLKNRKVSNPNSSGLLGLILGELARNVEHIRASVKNSTEELELDAHEEFRNTIINELDQVDELQQEAARLQHKALKIYKKVVLKNIDYG